MKPREAKKLIGQKVEWEFGHDKARGCFVRNGILEEVHGYNVVISGDYRWLPDLTNFKAAIDNVKNAET